jgi:hypothetical protein
LAYSTRYQYWIGAYQYFLTARSVSRYESRTSLRFLAVSVLRGHLVVDKDELDNYEDVAMITVSLLLRFELAAVATVMPGWRAYWRIKDG